MITDTCVLQEKVAHSTPRILFHEDITGKEITSKLLAQVPEAARMITIPCKQWLYAPSVDVVFSGLTGVDSDMGRGVESAVIST